MPDESFLHQLLHIKWHDMFVPSYSLIEIVLRGSIIYLALFALLRVARARHAGQMGLADILVIVLIADAVSNGMASEYRSVPEGLVLAGTIFFWSFALDWLGYHVPAMRPLIESGPRCLIRHGQLQMNAMRHELLTRDDLLGMLRERGIEGYRDSETRIHRGRWSTVSDLLQERRATTGRSEKAPLLLAVDVISICNRTAFSASSHRIAS